MNFLSSMLERLQAAGHDPYRMTLHQALHFDAALRDRSRIERANRTMDVRAAVLGMHAKEDPFEDHVKELLGIIDPDTLDFSEED